MPKVKLYNQEGTVVGDTELPERLFGVRANVAVIRRAIEAQQRNARPAIAHTKTRSEVRGGGRKPWRQKGTGRARHGSIRSPIWVGGGVTFGPRNTRNYSMRLNRKERQRALFMGLSEKARNERIIVLDQLTLAAIKTKSLAQLLAKLPLQGQSALIIQPGHDTVMIKSARNLPRISTIAANSLNLVDVMKHAYLLFPQDCIRVMEKTYNRAHE